MACYMMAFHIYVYIYHIYILYILLISLIYWGLAITHLMLERSWNAFSPITISWHGRRVCLAKVLATVPPAVEDGLCVGERIPNHLQTWLFLVGYSWGYIWKYRDVPSGKLSMAMEITILKMVNHQTKWAISIASHPIPCHPAGFFR